MPTLLVGSLAIMPSNWRSTNMMNIKYMEYALDQARTALANNNVPIGAVVVHEGCVIGCGYNRVMGGDRFGHAEMMALRMAHDAIAALRISSRRRVELFTTLEPCMMCLGAVMQVNIGKVIYALKAPTDGATHMAGPQVVHSAQIMKFYTPPIVEKGGGESESRQLLKKFYTEHSAHYLGKWALLLAEQ